MFSNKKPVNFDKDYQNFCADKHQLKASTAYSNRCSPDLFSQEKPQNSTN